MGIIRFANMPKKSVQRALDELQALNVIHYPKPRVIALTPDIYENLVESSLSKKILAQYPRIEF